MIRPSSLNMAKLCTLSPVLSEKFGKVTEATERGNLVDALVCNWILGGRDPNAIPDDPDAAACCRWILANLDGWTLAVQQQVTVRHPETGGVLTKGTPDIVARHTDMVWVVDLKKREQYWAGLLTDINEDMQTHAYALGAVQGSGASCYKKSYLLFGDGNADDKTSILFGPEQWADLYDTIREIYLQPTRATKGDHCLKCYGREHCTAWLMPAYEGETALEPFTRPQGLTVENAPRALDTIQALKKAVEVAEGMLKEYARKNGGIVVGDRRWAVVTMPGKRSVDIAALERDGLAEQYSKTGAPFEQFRWLRANKS